MPQASDPTRQAQALAEIPLFQGLPPAALQEMLRHGHSCQARKDEFFFMQGDEAEHLYVLTSGRVKLSQVTPEGQQVILRVLGVWQMFGGVALLGNDVFPVSAQAIEDSQALR
jgi:CRP-like cAMP-binding protein